MLRRALTWVLATLMSVTALQWPCGSGANQQFQRSAA
jgi:hypothetical protein